MSDVNAQIIEIKRETFERFKDSRRVWIIEECGAEFVVHSWHNDQYGLGVGPPTRYPTLRKAAARLLQLFGVGPIRPQDWPESICIGEVMTLQDQPVVKPRPTVEELEAILNSEEDNQNIVINPDGSISCISKEGT